MINEFFDPKSNFCNIYCFFVNSAFIFWSPWAHPVMNVRFWCVAFIRIYRNVRALGVNIKNKLIHYEIDISIRQVFGFFLNMWFLVAKDKNKAIILSTWSYLSQKYPLPVSPYFTLFLNSSYAFNKCNTFLFVRLSIYEKWRHNNCCYSQCAVILQNKRKHTPISDFLWQQTCIL